jgi:hypothetical protein
MFMSAYAKTIIISAWTYAMVFTFSPTQTDFKLHYKHGWWLRERRFICWCHQLLRLCSFSDRWMKYDLMVKRYGCIHLWLPIYSQKLNTWCWGILFSLVSVFLHVMTSDMVVSFVEEWSVRCITLLSAHARAHTNTKCNIGLHIQKATL